MSLMANHNIEFFAGVFFLAAWSRGLQHQARCFPFPVLTVKVNPMTLSELILFAHDRPSRYMPDQLIIRIDFTFTPLNTSCLYLSGA